MKFKKILAIALTTCIVSLSFSSLFQASAQIAEAQSDIQTSQSPTAEIAQKQFLINNRDDFSRFMVHSEYWTSDYEIVLTRNINMSGEKFRPIGEFSGKFDGGGHTISNFWVQDKHESVKSFKFAFIKTLSSSAEFKNVTFNNYNIEDKGAPGVLPKSYTAAGFILVNYGSISGVNFTNSSAFSINNTNKIGEVAGFVLTNEKEGVITNCSIDMKSRESNINAGFVGKNSGFISESIANVDVTNSLYVGGFCGMNSGVISKCQSKGNINTETKYKTMICGGFVGVNAGFIDSCTSTGSLQVKKVNSDGAKIAAIIAGVVLFVTVIVVMFVVTPAIWGVLGGAVLLGAGGIGTAAATASIPIGLKIAAIGLSMAISMAAETIVIGATVGGVAATNEIGGAHVGGFCGDNLGAISSCESYGSATTNTDICGGFVGTNSGGIEKCIATGKATSKTKTSKVFVGGFVAENIAGKISDCVASGGADSRSSTGQAKAGGFVGVNKASIVSSKASGYVYLSSGVGRTDNGCGGFVGKNDKDGNIDSCYAECKVETTNKKKGGGFVGEAENKSTITNSKCQSMLVTKKGTTNKIDFCQNKSKKAVIKN
ncbi:MAG: hypothetical protein K2G97_04775 [Oscillospiraceae bacterium]|nr:hypothetical protein [Oscillospiraceae bacterium]